MMSRSLLYIGAAYYLVIGVSMLSGPVDWFQGTPGVAETGGYNGHFIIDIAFAFLVSGAAIGAGVWLRQRSLILAGLGWPVLHGAFHVAGLVQHGAVSTLAWWTDAGGVILPAMILLAAAINTPMRGLGAGMARLLHAGLQRFEAQWSYDATYQHRLLDLVPDSARFLMALQAIAQASREAPAPLRHGAALAASLHEDCGPCAQLTLDMMRAEGAEPDEMRALLRRDFEAAHPLSELGFRFVEAVLAGDVEADTLREAIIDRCGEASLATISLTVTVSRTYPALKKLMGCGSVCRRLDVDGQSETVNAV